MEAEINELRAKVIASMPSSSTNPNSNQSKEEGELSSGEEAAELPISTNLPVDTSSLEQIPSNTLSSHPQHVKSVKTPLPSSSLVQYQPRTLVSQNYSKHLRGKQIPYKSIPQNLSWHGRGSDDNLVISFSDDESKSSSEKSKSKERISSKVDTRRTYKSNIPSSSAHAHSGRSHQWTNRTKSEQKKGATANALPFLTRRANSWHPIVPVDDKSVKHNPVIKNSGSQEHKLVQDMDGTNHTVESLRHEIALRETKLKVQGKSTPPSYVRDASPQSNQNIPHDMKNETNVATNRKPEPVIAGGLATKIAGTSAVVGSNSVSSVGVSGKRLPKRAKLDGRLDSEWSTDKKQLQSTDTSAHDCSRQFMKRNESRMDNHKVDNDSGTSDPVSCDVPIKKAEDGEVLRATNGTSCSSFGKHEVLSDSGKCGMLVSDVSRRSYFSGVTPNMNDEAVRGSEKSTPIVVTPRDSNISRKIDAPNAFANKVPPEPNTERSQQILTIHKNAPLETLNRTSDKFSVELLGRKSANNEDAGPSNYSSQMKVSEEAARNLQSLVELEELHDKELEEAQELRRRCEVEERCARKAYRKAQRALLEATESCNRLYRKRELYSAQVPALFMAASTSIWPLSGDTDRGNLPERLENVPESSFNILSSLGPHFPTGQILEQLGYEPSSDCAVDAPHNTSLQDMNIQELVSSHCSEQDASTSGNRDNNRGDCAPSNNSIVPIDGENPFDNRYGESRFACDAREICGQKTACVNAEAERVLPEDNIQDYGLLEASLRSALVARLSRRMSSKSNGTSETGCPVQKGSDMNENSNPTCLPESQIQDKNLTTDLRGVEMPKSSNQINEELLDQCHGNSFSITDNMRKDIDAEGVCSFGTDTCLPKTTGFSLPSSILHVASGHLKSIMPGPCSEIPNTKMGTSTIKITDDVPYDEDNKVCYNARSAERGEMIFSTCNLEVDPFWPFCMFELRGKCNNDECQFQHLTGHRLKRKEHTEHSVYSGSNTLHSPTDGYSSQPLADAVGSPHMLPHHMLPVPTYYIGSTLIKVYSHLSQSTLAHNVWQYWQTGFCASFSVPFSVQRILLADAPLLQTGNDPSADDYDWNRLSLHYETLNYRMKQVVQALPGPEQSLETALYLFDRNVNKQQREKALSLLSRSIEADPTSVVHWVVYLHIYYAQEKSIGKDDMFLEAVKHNQGSYELWLLYINSRIQFNHRLDAYEYALTTFCDKDDFNIEERYASACILDIFLQMIEFLCMSGNVETVIQRISKLLGTSTDTLLLSLHSCLVISDRCIFWFCCVYLAIYRKLPKQIVRQFELEKSIPWDVDWPSIHLAENESKDVALGLMKLAVDLMGLDVDINPHKKDPYSLRSLQFLAVSHIRCVTVVEGLHPAAGLLANYLKLYPTCIELVLMSARCHESCDDNAVFRDFEELLTNWSKESSGLQCLWNQYIEQALAYRRTDFAESLMIRWFRYFCEDKERTDRSLDDGNDSFSAIISCVKEDEMFGYLNLSLKGLLQNNAKEAQLAIEKALKLASGEDYKHCVREHAAFTFSNIPDNQTSASFGIVLGLLNGYMKDSRAASILEPLSRKFCRDIKKPRVAHSVNIILGPVSADSTLMNSVLEICYGASLLPARPDNYKKFADFVESLMELTPANYELALSVYRITINFLHAGVAAKAVKFWASSLLINAIFQAVPAAPENIWQEAATLLRDSENVDISLRFHQQAISVYPFSINLLQSFLILSKKTGNTGAIVEDAKERGLTLNHVPD